MLKAGLIFFSMVSTVAWAHGEAPLLELAPITQSDIPSIRHLGEFDTQHILVRGGRPTSEQDVRMLAKNGVKFIIDVQGGDYSGNAIIGGLVPYWEKGEKPEDIKQERAWAKANGIDFISLPLNSLKQLNADNIHNVLAALTILHQYELAGGKLGKVFIHCAHGVDRTGMIVALYRVLYQQWDADAAYAEWRRSGHTLANMTATWHLDEFFFAAIHTFQQNGVLVTRSGLCEYNLLF